MYNKSSLIKPVEDYMNTYKKKFRGQKVSFRFLESHETIQQGDLFILSNDKEHILTLNNLNSFLETRCVGEIVSEHPERSYIRILQK